MKHLSPLRANPHMRIDKWYRNHLKQTTDFFKSQNLDTAKVLDIGQRSPLTDSLENEFDIKIDNTTGDLDSKFSIPGKQYEVIIYSHTIEHQFSPLNTLLMLKKVMTNDTILYIILPNRTKLLWTNIHYHEIDEYRMELLLKRANLKVISKTKQRVWRSWWKYLTGIRPLFRLFLECNAIYMVKNDWKI